MFWGWLSDRMVDRRWTLFWTCVLSATGLVIAGMTIGHVVVVGGDVDRRRRVLRNQGAVLVDADDVPDRRGRGLGDRLDQFNRQPRRLFGPSLVGWAKNLSAQGDAGPLGFIGHLNGYAPGLFALALCAIASAFISLFVLRIPAAVRAGEELAPAE